MGRLRRAIESNVALTVLEIARDSLQHWQTNKTEIYFGIFEVFINRQNWQKEGHCLNSSCRLEQVRSFYNPSLLYGYADVSDHFQRPFDGPLDHHTGVPTLWILLRWIRSLLLHLLLGCSLFLQYPSHQLIGNSFHILRIYTRTLAWELDNDLVLHGVRVYKAVNDPVFQAN